MSARENYRTSNAYTSNSYSSTKSKTTTTNTTGGGDNNRETYRTTTYTKPIDPKVKARNDLALKVAKQKKDAEAFKNMKYEPPKFVPSIAGKIFSNLVGEKTFNVNKSYYEKNVIGKAKPGGGFYGASTEDFKGYMQGRGSGTVDAMGRTISNNNDGGSYVVEKKIGGNTILTETPTSAEVSQAKATEQVIEDEETRKRRVKAKGRSPTILTGVTGATGGLTLGKPSLLGRA
jgi:hypothetical protein